MSDANNEQLERMRRSLDQVSPSFCLAKWTQVTIHLANGRTHSCHHPRVHDVPLEELRDNPSALHNTPEKIATRKEMLEGKRPAECAYCWRVEDAHPQNVSDRVYKSGSPWSARRFEEVLENPLDPRFVPSYVEVSLGDACNFKCSYCMPEVSTSWRAEIQKHGPYPTSRKHNSLEEHRVPFPADANPYADAWEKWWPEIYPRLTNFRVTGGEPLLNKRFFRTLDWIEKNPNRKLSFAVNTNLCPPESAWTEFVDRIRRISQSRAVKNVTIYTSAEAWGAQAEYIRHGMNFEVWRERLWQVLRELPHVQLTIMATYNALSLTTFRSLQEEVLKIKATAELRNEMRDTGILLDPTLLHLPHHQSVRILPREEWGRVEEHLGFMLRNQDAESGFTDYEVMKMRNILNVIRGPSPEDGELNRHRADFFSFFSEHDRRRGTDFLKTFPELESFWHSCRDLQAGFA